MKVEGKFIIPALKKEFFGYFIKEKNTIKLSLFGEIPYSRKQLRFPFIHAQTINGCYTLIDCIWQGHTKTNFDSHVSENYIYSYRMIKGHFFNNQNELLFNTLKFNFIGLKEWINKSGIKKTDLYKGINIEYKNPKNIKFNINDDFSGEFVFNFFPHPKNSNESDSVAEVHQEVFINLSSAKPLPLNRFFELRDKIMTFLSLSTNYLLKPYIQRLFSNNIKKNKQNIELILIETNETERFIFPKRHWFPFKFTDIENEFNSYLLKWFEIEKDMSPSANIFLHFFNEQLNITNQFILLSQALENYHARFRQSNETYTRSEKDSYGGPKYKTRIKRILLYFIEKISDKFIKEDDVSDLSKDIVETRDYYTHFLNSKKETKMAETELLNYTPKLISILHLLMLHETGIPKSKFSKFIEFKKFTIYTDIEDISEILKS